MRVKFFKTAMALATAGTIAAVAFGGEANTQTSSASAESSSRSYSSGPAVFAGLGMGYGRVSDGAFKAGPDGPAYFAGATFSWKLENWALDTGLGWLYSSVSGSIANGLPAAIRTRSALATLGARYLIGPHWQVGPAVNMAFGADTGPGPSVGGSSLSPYLGVRGVYETDLSDSVALRGFAQASSRVGMPEGNVLLALAGVEIGLPFGGKPSAPVEDRVKTASAAPAPEYIKELKLQLDPQKVFFRTNSAQLKNGVQDTLRSVGEYLKENTWNWSRVEVSGHADRRGNYDYNLKLSDRRAQSVADSIRTGGIAPDRIAVRAFSSGHPVDKRDNPKAWALNRRVELVLHDVYAPRELIEKLKPLLNQKPGDQG